MLITTVTNNTFSYQSAMSVSQKKHLAIPISKYGIFHSDKKDIFISLF